jgi:hypothetical protein
MSYNIPLIGNSRSAMILFVFITIFFAACAASSKDAPPPQSATTSQTTVSPTPSSLPIAVGHDSTVPASSTSSAPAAQGNAGELKWTAPSGWKSGPERPMRAATYLVPAAGGDKEGGECAVFMNIGGGVKANIDRWISQFKQPDGSSSQAKARQNKEPINGLQVTTVDLTGTFTGSGMAMGPPSPEKPGYRLLGAIVETPQGEVFFKLTGPEKTIASAEADFKSLLKSIKL